MSYLTQDGGTLTRSMLTVLQHCRLRLVPGSLLLALLGTTTLAVADSPPEGPVVEVASESERLFSDSFALLISRVDRLMRVGDPIRLHNTQFCPRLGPVLGMSVLTKREIGEALWPAARKVLPLDQRVRVLSMLPDYPASQAGLAVGDAILKVGNQKIKKSSDIRELRFRREDSASWEIVPFVIERKGKRLEIDVAYWPGCSETADLSWSETINAYAGYRQILFTAGILRFLPDDDALATIMGHELAHIVLTHRFSKSTWEEEADYMGLYFAARAGFDISNAFETEERFSLLSYRGLRYRPGRSHPTYPARVASMKATIEEINAKVAAGQPLVPERVE